MCKKTTPLRIQTIGGVISDNIRARAKYDETTISKQMTIAIERFVNDYSHVLDVPSKQCIPCREIRIRDMDEEKLSEFLSISDALKVDASQLAKCVYAIYRMKK